MAYLAEVGYLASFLSNLGCAKKKERAGIKLYVLCENVEESSQRILMYCPFRKEVWWEILSLT